MVQHRIGDLLEIEEDGKYFYIVVLTRVVLFGGNFIFAFHNQGKKYGVQFLAAGSGGFNICADLLWPKREGRVKRLHHFEDVAPFWKSKFVKATAEYRPGVKSNNWFIYKVEDLAHPIARIAELSTEHQMAIDSGCYSFDLVAAKILAGYTPDKNEHI